MTELEQAELQAQARIQTAVEQRSPLRLRGGGSKAFHTGFTDSADATSVLDTRSLRGVVSYEPSELVVTVGAGTPLAELEALLATHGQCLPFEPPHYRWSNGPEGQAAEATVGGMVASALAGPARASVGSVRDYVLGLQLINGLAQPLTFGGQVMKNVAGYDVSRLMAGSQGTLGLITRVSLKVLPRAPAEATLCFSMNAADALEQLHRWGGRPLPLNASCWVRDDTAAAGPVDLLFVRLRGAHAAVEAACTTMLAEAPGQRMDNAVAQPDWERCRNHELPFFARPHDPSLALWRVSVPQTAPVLSLAWPQLLEWHGGLRWLWAPLDAASVIQSAAQAVGGTARIFVGPRNGAAIGPASAEQPAVAAITQRLKTAFDPHGIFNPGVALA